MERIDYRTVADDGTTLASLLWLPDELGKRRAQVDTWERGSDQDAQRAGMVQLVHGVGEHKERYARFAKRLTDAGYPVCAHDQRGHGATAERDGGGGSGSRSGDRGDGGRLGAVERGARRKMTGDIDAVRAEAVRQMRTRLNGSELPEQPRFVLFGHSMGAALVRLWLCSAAASKAGSALCGCIISAPPAEIGPEVLAGRLLAGAVALTRGSRRQSALLDRVAYGPYRRAISDGSTLFDWLSRDSAEVERYLEDRRCGFAPTPALFAELIRTIHEAGLRRCVAAALCPMLIAAGSADPVSGAGHAAERLAARLRAAGNERVETLLYDGARHELLNETNREEVMTDMLRWIGRTLAGS